jgi:cytochrome P450 family 142 subfamily A polypeptide 1
MSFADTNLMSLDVHTFNPEPFYNYLRDEEPLYWDKESELWAVARYEDVVFISRNTDIFSSAQGVVPKVSPEDWPDEAMINLDGRAHTKQRALVSKGFTPKRVNDLEDYAREVMIGLVEKVIKDGECCLVKDLARPLPMRLIGKMLDYPLEKQDEILEWTDVYTHAGCGPDHITGDVIENFGNFTEFHMEFLQEKMEKPGDDLLTVWLNAELDGERLGPEKLLFEHNLLLVGGSETTRNAISGGMQELMKHPDQQKYLVENLDDPDVVSNAVEEMIRWSTPFVRMARTLTKDYEYHGKQMKEGQQIIMLYPAANRDPKVFDNPDQFDIKRKFSRPAVSFGYGKHFCIGASLARLEVKVFLQEVLKRIPDMANHTEKEPVQSPSCFIRGLKTLPVTFSRA